MKRIDWNNVEDPKEYAKLPAGGYICKITAVQDVPDKEYLNIEYDIADGEFKGYFRELYMNKSFWGGRFVKSYKEKALPFFKGFLTAVGNSNANFKFNDEEKNLIDKYIGLVLGEEEYIGNDRQMKKRLYVASIHSVDKIKNHDFTVPDLKKYEMKDSVETNIFRAPDTFPELAEDDICPF